MAPGLPLRRSTRVARFHQRQEERRREEARVKRNRRIQRASYWGGGLLLVGLIAFAVVRGITSAPPKRIAGVVSYSNLSRSHVNGSVTYTQNPPAGGNHNAVWLNCGVYDAPVTNENAVHSLEHGAVWITYQPTLASDAVDHLRGLASSHSHVILSPYPGLPAPVVASAWGVQLKVQSASDSRLSQFIAKYELGSQTPEPGAACSGGTGTPIS